MKHNPYVGSFHGVQRPSEEHLDISAARHNPHLGIIRHSPAAGTLPLKLNMGFKGLLSDEPVWKTSVMSHLQIAAYNSETGSAFFSSPIETNFQLHLTERLINRIPTAIFSYPNYYSNHTNMSGMQVDAENGLDNIGVSQQDWFHIPFLDCDDQIPACAICLERFEDGCEIRKLACNHCYHKKCIDIWLTGQHSHVTMKTNICPTCRQSAVPASVCASPCGNSIANAQLSSNVPEGSASDPDIIAKCRHSLECDVDLNVLIESCNGLLSPFINPSPVEIESNVEILSPVEIRSRSIVEDSMAIVVEELSIGDNSSKSTTDSKIPDSAFSNVGRFLMSGFGYLASTKATTDDNIQTANRDIVGAAVTSMPTPKGLSDEYTQSTDSTRSIPMDPDDCSMESASLESAYDLCDVPIEARGADMK